MCVFVFFSFIQLLPLFSSFSSYWAIKCICMHLFCLLFVCLLYLFSYPLCLMSPYSSPFFLLILSIFSQHSYALLIHAIERLQRVFVLLQYGCVGFSLLTKQRFFVLFHLTHCWPSLLLATFGHSKPVPQFVFSVVCMYRSIFLAFTLSFSLFVSLLHSHSNIHTHTRARTFTRPHLPCLAPHYRRGRRALCKNT